MNLLQIGIKLKAENIQSFIDDFLKIDGVTISDIQLHDDMILINKIKYKSFATVSLGLKIERVEDGIVSITVKKLKAISIPISVIPINFILKIVLSKLNIPGIYSDGKQISIDLSTIFKEYNIDFLALAIKDIQITKEDINIVVDDINFDLDSLISKNKSKNEKIKEEVSEDIHRIKDEINSGIKELKENIEEFEKESIVDKFVDQEQYYDREYVYNGKPFDKKDKGYFNEYTRFRKRIYNEKFKNIDKDLLGKIVFALPDIAVLCYRLLRDGRVSKSLKILLGFTVAYLASPWDLFNNKNTIFNKIDDGLLLVFTLSKIFTSVDINLLKNHFDGDNETLYFLIDIFDVLNEFLGIDKINKIYTVVEKFVR